jgi:aminoglycoside phosphotransferase (APT) family kinase protein
VTTPTIPTRIEHVTPEWLTAFLAVRHPGVRVDELEILQHTQGAATRLRLRVRYAEDARAGLPEVLFLKTSLTRRMLVADPHMYLTEVRFYDRIRPTLDCETPAVYACDVDEATNRFAAVIEDVSQRTARFPTAASDLSADELAPLMSTLAALHAANWGRPDLESTFGWLETSTRGRSADWWRSADGRSVFEQELGEDYKAAAVDPDRHPVERLYRAFGRLQQVNDEGPATVLHGDTHIGNCYQLPDGTFGLLDWQLMRVANWANDVAYAIVTALDVETRRTGERDLLRHYLGELTARGVAAPTWDHAWDLYRRQMIWGIVTWTVTPTSMYTRDLLDRLIRRSVVAADDLDTYAALGC